ncbi:MAG TPA: cysteine desulfurase-like protein [Bacillota bacterium]|nr:cysteine desulfurase-like protein [Bacillota bacterium]
MSKLDVRYCRGLFPSLALEEGGRPVAYLDAPAGTQVPQMVVDSVAAYFREANANVGGAYRTSRATDRIIAEARAAMADLLGAQADEIAFGANMTTLTYALSRAIGQTLAAGDEVVVTEMDHEANVSPWRALAERGAVVRTLAMDPATCQLAPLETCLGPRTRVVALGYASNALGTVNDVRRAASLCREAGAVLVVDAVHYLPHAPVDVRDLDCDFLLASTYKVFGPHLGLLYGRKAAFERLPAYRLRVQRPYPPEKLETGTLNHEGLAGLLGTVAFLEDIGRRSGGQGDRRGILRAAMAAIAGHGTALGEQLYRGLVGLPGVRVFGPPPGAPRTPTYSFTLAGHTPRQVAEHLGSRGVFVSDGDFYAPDPIERLGLAGSGGLVRAGLAPYSDEEDVARLLEGLAELAG